MNIDHSMKHRLIWDEVPNCVIIRAGGKASLEGIVAFHSEYLGDSRWEPGMNILCDFRELLADHFEISDIKKISQLVEKAQDKIGDGRMAVVQPDITSYGLTRMFELITEGKTQLDIMVFRSYDEALLWIQS